MSNNNNNNNKLAIFSTFQNGDFWCNVAKVGTQPQWPEMVKKLLCFTKYILFHHKKHIKSIKNQTQKNSGAKTYLSLSIVIFT